jgi:hypothetical protein
MQGDITVIGDKEYIEIGYRSPYTGEVININREAYELLTAEDRETLNREGPEGLMPGYWILKFAERFIPSKTIRSNQTEDM